jgi:glutathione S-transferase
MSLTLYYHPLSSFCHKALIALYENGAAFDKRLIDLSQAGDRDALRAVWPIGKFPVLHDPVRDRNVAESSIIIEYLDRFFPGTQALIPAHADAALDVRFWDRFFDTYVHAPMQRIVADRMGPAPGAMAAERALLHLAYGMIDRQVTDRGWVVGDGFSLADCAAAPALFYATTLEPIPAGREALAGYFERLIARPSVHRVLDEAKPYFRFYPFFEAIPSRFLE